MNQPKILTQCGVSLLAVCFSAFVQAQTPWQPTTQAAASTAVGADQNTQPPVGMTVPPRTQDGQTTPSRDLGRLGYDPLPTGQAEDDRRNGASRARVAPRNDPPSQFQLFVKESTGRLLPVFGSQIFDSPQGYVPDSGLAAPANYILGAGDEVRIQVWGAIDFVATLIVDRNGQVAIPKIGSVSLAGVALGNLEQVLKSHVSKVYTNFNLNATLGKLRSVQVFVVGQARQPGAYTVSSLSTLVSVLFQSGGPNANGSMRAIELQRGGKTISRMDLYDFIGKGDKSADTTLMPGDVIFIPPAGKRVAVTGAFDQAAIYEIKEGSAAIGDILALGGGASPVANVRKALLERVQPDRLPARQVQEVALDAQGLKQNFQSGDILTLLPVSPAFANAVTLQGVVAEPLRYRWFEGMKVLDLIPNKEALISADYFKRKNALVQIDAGARTGNRAGAQGRDTQGRDTQGRDTQSRDTLGRDAELVLQPNETSASVKDAGAKVAERFRTMADQINWEYAVIERMDPVKLTVRLIPFNLGRALLQNDASQNLVLQPGDVVTILSQTELAMPQERLSRIVRVEGEVAAPGIYQLSPGETLPQLIKRIGGLTAQAYLFGTELNRETVRTRQQENLDNLVRRLETQLQSQVRINPATNPQDAASLLAVQQQQQAQLKSQVDRLRNMKSSGRLALELDPRIQALSGLPGLPLEDGDRVLVPSTPGFVSAVGAVNNESAMIYRPGRTIGELIRSASVTDDAELDAAFVLRADGSVFARGASGSIFGSSFESALVMPGDTLVVPTKLDRESGYNFTVRALKDWTQIISNLGIGAAAIKTLRN